MSELHHNFKTHRDAWRDAIVGMINASGPSGVDHDERGYWEHELKAYDEAFGSLSSQSPAPIPEQVAQTTFAERLYGNGPDIDQRRDALYTMALIFAAAETDSAREATFEDMFKEFCTVPRIAIFDSLTRHTGAEVATNYTFETEEFFEVEAVERLLATQSAKQGAQPADLSHRLRETADQQPGWKPLLMAAVEEIERYYDGMLAWKQTAEKKDRDWNAERMARVNERCAERAAAPLQTMDDTTRDEAIEAIAAWYEQVGYMFDEGDIADLIRRFKSTGPASTDQKGSDHA